MRVDVSRATATLAVVLHLPTRPFFLSRHAYCIGKFLLTGTPIKNGRLINLYPLLLLLKHLLTSNKRDYEKNYCNAYLGEIGDKNIWINTGSSNLD